MTGSGAKAAAIVAMPSRELVDVERDRVGVTRHLAPDRVLEIGVECVELEQRARVHADHPVDDELEPCEADATVRNPGEIERPVGVADVHHDLDRNLRQRVELDARLLEVELTFVDVAGVALRTGHRDGLTLVDRLGRIAAADDGRDSELPGDDRCVTGAAAAVGDDGGGALHDRLPVGIGHVGDQYVAALDAGHLAHVADDARGPCADALADAPSAREYLRATPERVALHDATCAALHGLRTRLQDVDASGLAVLAPLDVHGAAVVLFDDQRLARELEQIARHPGRSACGRPRKPRPW